MWLKSAGENSSADENSFPKLVAPNITGGWAAYSWLGFEGWGAMRTRSDASTFAVKSDEATSLAFEGLDFDASLLSSVYQNHAPLQPAALLSLVAIRF